MGGESSSKRQKGLLLALVNVDRLSGACRTFKGTIARKKGVNRKRRYHVASWAADGDCGNLGRGDVLLSSPEKERGGTNRKGKSSDWVTSLPRSNEGGKSIDFYSGAKKKIHGSFCQREGLKTGGNGVPLQVRTSGSRSGGVKRRGFGRGSVPWEQFSVRNIYRKGGKMR